MKWHLGYFWKLFCINFLSLQLVLGQSLPGRRDGPRRSALEQGLQIAQGQLSQAQRMQQQQQMAMALNMADPRHSIPDEFELGCNLLPPNPPTGLPRCQGDPQLAQFLVQMYSNNRDTYKVRLEGDLKCLEDRKDIYQGQLKNHEEGIRELVGKIKEASEQLMVSIGGDKNAIRDANSTLEGGRSRPGVVEPERRPYVSFLNPNNCPSIITEERAEEIGKRGGLRGIKEHLDEHNSKAQGVLKTNFEKIAADKIRRAVSRFSRFGHDGLMNDPHTSNYRGLDKTYRDFTQEFSQEMGRIKNDLEQYLGGQSPLARKVPPLDKNFSRELGRIKQRSTNERTSLSWKSQFMESCMNGNPVTGGGYDYMIANLERRKIRGQDLVRRYQRKLREIKASGVSAIAKRNAIARFDQKYAKTRHRVTLPGPNGPVTVTEFLQTNYRNCEVQFRTQKIARDPKTGGPVSYETLQNRAVQSINEAEQIYNSFTKNMSDAIKEKFLQCDGENYVRDPAGPRGCSKDGVLNPQSEAFCAVNARSCAHDVSSCFTGLKGMIAEVERKKDFHSNQLNQKLVGYRNDLKAQLRTITQQAKQFNAALRQRFPFLPPLALQEGDLFLKGGVAQYTEELKAAIIEGGNVEDIRNKFEQLIENNVIQALEGQRTALMDKIATSIDRTRASYERAKQEWEGLEKQCVDVIAKFHQQQMEAQKAQQEAQKEHMTAANTVCSVRLQANSINCPDLDNLTESFGKIAPFASPEDGNIVRAFQDQCRSLDARDNIIEQYEDNESRMSGFIVEVCQLTEIDRGGDPDNFSAIPDKYNFYSDSADKAQIVKTCVEIRNKYKREMSDGPQTTIASGGESTSLVVKDPIESAIQFKREAFSNLIVAVANKKIEDDLGTEFGEQKELPLCEALREGNRDSRDPFNQRRDRDDGNDLMGRGGTVR